MVGGALDILLHHSTQWWPQLVRHVWLSVIALAFAIAIGIPLGAYLTRRERAALAVISVANLGRTIPSLALLALVYPLVGTGALPAIVALVALAVPPILLATYTGVREVDPSIADAASGMGLSSRERLIAVELPIAAPVIISGVRTSATQVVASATLAALIGGGGLGEMILAGLTNMRFDLLLAGSLLVALLAVATELLFARLESHWLPEGMRHVAGTAAETARPGSDWVAGAGVTAAHWRKVVPVLALVAGGVLVAGGSASAFVAGIGGPSASNGAGGPLPTIRIGSKDFTEQLVLGELYAQSLEAQGFPVERHLDLGATAVADAALQHGTIDMYPEYTGTALTAVLHRDVPGAVGGGSSSGEHAARADAVVDGGGVGDDPQSAAVYAAVDRGYGRRGMALLAQTPFSNGNAIVMRASRAKALHVQTMSDLRRASGHMHFGSVPGFDARPDGLPLLRKAYGIRFASVKTFEIGLKYKALVDGKVDAVYGFETDGQIARDGLVVLRDDRHVWPPYHAVPIVSKAALAKAGPALAPTINSVTMLLDAKTMRRLNDAVDRDKRDPRDVAHEFLRAKGLLRDAGARPTVRIGSKDFTEQFVLGELYAQALEARGYPVERHLNLGATAVADAALRRGTIDFYPEYDGTALTAVLKRTAPDGATTRTVDSMVRHGYAPRGQEVLAPTTFNDGNAIVMTAARARELHVRTLADLHRVSGRMKFGSVPGFDTRPDGLPLLATRYGIHFGNVKSFEIGLKYKALADGKVDAVYGFETDGQIARDHLVVLQDTRHVWPPYHAVPIVSKRLMADVGPEFAATVDNVSRMLDARTMQRLNDQVDRDKRDPADVARAWLRANHLA